MRARRRLVRIHQGDGTPSLEGVLVEKPWRRGGFFCVRQPAAVVGPDETVEFQAGTEVWVPRERVVWVEVLSR